jgi:hypothetical protein
VSRGLNTDAFRGGKKITSDWGEGGTKYRTLPCRWLGTGNRRQHVDPGGWRLNPNLPPLVAEDLRAPDVWSRLDGLGRLDLWSRVVDGPGGLDLWSWVVDGLGGLGLCCRVVDRLGGLELWRLML